MNRNPLLLTIFFALFCCTASKADYAPDNAQGVMLHSTITSTTIPNGDSLIGLTTVVITSQTGLTFDNYALGNDDIILTNLSYVYRKTSPNVATITTWDPTLFEYVTTTYTFTDYDRGTVYSSSSIGNVRGTFKIWELWDWNDQEAYWDQATAAQNAYILADPSRLGLYNQTQLNTAVSQAKEGLYTQQEVDQAVSNATSGLYTQAQVDSAIATAKSGMYTQAQLDEAVANAAVFFKSEAGWDLVDSSNTSFTLSIKRSSDLSDWQTVVESEISFAGTSSPSFIFVEAK